MKHQIFSLIVGTSLLLTGCASIVSSGNEIVTISTNVPESQLNIRNSQNLLIYTGSTPTMLSLKKKKGFFSGETYHIHAQKQGYADTYTILDTRISWWYLGNIVFGGLIGFLFVDPATGAMWTFEEENLFLNLQKKEG